MKRKSPEPMCDSRLQKSSMSPNNPGVEYPG